LGHAEREAVEAAEGGNFTPLAALLRPSHPLNQSQIKPPIMAALKPETYALIADVLSGQARGRSTGRG
jgi:hypothetical protein